MLTTFRCALSLVFLLVIAPGLVSGEETSTNVAGLYFGVSLHGTTVRGAAVMRIGENWKYLLPDGRAVSGFPEGGFSGYRFDQESYGEIGHYTVTGDEIVIRYKGGREEKFKREMAGFSDGYSTYALLPTVEGLTLDGTYKLTEAEGAYDTYWDLLERAQIVFTRDGRFSDREIVGDVGPGFDETRKVGSGTYVIKNHSLILRYADGQTLQMAFAVMTDDEHTSSSDVVRVGRKNLRKVSGASSRSAMEKTNVSADTLIELHLIGRLPDMRMEKELPVLVLEQTGNQEGRYCIVPIEQLPSTGFRDEKLAHLVKTLPPTDKGAFAIKDARLALRPERGGMKVFEATPWGYADRSTGFLSLPNVGTGDLFGEYRLRSDGPVKETVFFDSGGKFLDKGLLAHLLKDLSPIPKYSYGSYKSQNHTVSFVWPNGDRHNIRVLQFLGNDLQRDVKHVAVGGEMLELIEDK